MAHSRCVISTRPPPLAPHPPDLIPFPPRPCAQLAGRSSEEARMRALRVDELGDDDAIKAKVGRSAAWLGLGG